MSLDNLDKKTLFIFFVVILLNALPQVYLWNHTSDDAFISFRYAERMLDGKGLTFNDGEHVEGFSNPLWIILIACVSKITLIDIPFTSKILGFLSSVLICYFILLISKSLLEKTKRIIFLIFSYSIILFTPGFHVYSTAGLEGPLLSLLLVAGTYFSITDKKNHLYIASLLMGLVGICRPEGLLYSFLWLFFTYNFGRDKNTSFLIRLVIVLFPNLVYFIFRWFYFGNILPNTFYAKPIGTYSYLFGLYDTLKYFIVLPFPLIIVLIFFYFNRNKISNKFLLTILGLLLANFIFVLYANGDWMYFGRFFLPAWPLWIMGFTYLLLDFIYSHIKQVFKVKMLLYLCLFAILSTQIILFQNQWTEYKQNNNLANLMKGNDQLLVGQWLNMHIKPNSTVATFRLGGISYGAPQLIFFDTFGLTDKEVANFRNSNHTNYDTELNPVIQRHPNILAVINDHGFRRVTIEILKGFDKFLEVNYELIKSFPQGTGVSFEIWIDKSKIENILI